MYEPRVYRNQMNTGRFTSFVLSIKESDLWIGCDSASFKKEMADYASTYILNLRKSLESHIESNPEFQNSLKPIENSLNFSKIAREMIIAGNKAGIGPMSAVAGAFSQYIGLALIETFGCRELVVENGGDLFISVEKELTISVYAGKSPLSEKIAIVIPQNFGNIGVCTSSGTVGHSFSYGTADALMIACRNTLLADAYATAFANLVKHENDVETVINSIKSHPEILSAVVIKGKKMAVCGGLELKII
ncbi:MAG: UPF0280 family protein [Bacteroidales bacterium]|nr:UPF0280 family protein [Bacteroidales bacterium]